MRRSSWYIVILVFSTAFSAEVLAAEISKTPTKPYVVPRPALSGLHLLMNADSVDIMMRKVALRVQRLKVDSLSLIESDSVRIFGEPAYIQVQLLRGKVRTIVINFHPLSGERYLNTRNTLNSYLERFFGRGVITQNESVVNRRWENEDGTMEVSYSDKYTRVFVRLGKH